MEDQNDKLVSVLDGIVKKIHHISHSDIYNHGEKSPRSSNRINLLPAPLSITFVQLRQLSRDIHAFTQKGKSKLNLCKTELHKHLLQLESALSEKNLVEREIETCKKKTGANLDPDASPNNTSNQSLNSTSDGWLYEKVLEEYESQPIASDGSPNEMEFEENGDETIWKLEREKSERLKLLELVKEERKEKNELVLELKNQKEKFDQMENQLNIILKVSKTLQDLSGYQPKSATSEAPMETEPALTDEENERE